MDNNKVSWFGRAKAAVKAAAVKVASTLSRVKDAAVAKFSLFRASRLGRVISKIARCATLILAAVAALTALFEAPAVTILVCASAGLLWCGWQLGIKAYGGASVLRACWKIERIVLAVANFVFGIVQALVFVAIVTVAAMSPWGIVDFALLFWFVWTLETEADATTPGELAAARRSRDAAWTAIQVKDTLRELHRATA